MSSILNEQNKKILEQQANQISESDIHEVKLKLPEEFKNIEKLLNEHPNNKTLPKVLKSGELFFEILSDGEFSHHATSKKWMAFALKYLISPIDLIPDTIGPFGYYDDNLVLQWVEYLVEDEINRYRSYLLAKKHIHEGKLLENIAKGSGKTFILVPGIFTRNESNEVNINWTEQIKYHFPDASIFVFRWVHSMYNELQNVCQILNHEIYLKTAFNYERLEINWKDANLNAGLYAHALARCIKEEELLHNTSLSIAGHSMGCQLIVDALPFIDTPIDKLIFLAASTIERKQILENSHKFNTFINAYTSKDNVLKFLFEKFSSNHHPLGLSPLLETPAEKITDLNVSDLISKHSDYSEKLPEILKKLNLYF